VPARSRAVGWRGSPAFLVAATVIAVACSRTVSPTSDRPRTADAGPASSHAPPSIASGDASTGPPAVDPPGFYMGREIAAPMSYRGADWLDRADRDAVQKPEHVLDVLRIGAGQTVADVGCGTGYFTVRLARRVGDRGKVIATDLQQEMLDLLQKRLRAAGIGNVVARLATAEDAALPPNAIDLVLLVDVYHEVPNPPRTLAQIKTSLAPRGRLALVEYRAEDPNVRIKPEHKTTLAQLKRELEANGWSFVSSDESLPEQRIVVFSPRD
jgi:ubiquinone/menaquinone biosynthesis C-methylase UbiE